MQLFDLSLFQKGSKTIIANLPPSSSPYGSFSKGDAILWSGKNWSVDEVWFTLVSQTDGSTLCRTALSLTPYITLAGGDLVPWPWFADSENDIDYEGVGETLEMAVGRAHDKIPSSPDRDFVISKVKEWGMQKGGITNQSRFYAKVNVDRTSTFKSDPKIGFTDD